MVNPNRVTLADRARWIATSDKAAYQQQVEDDNYQRALQLISEQDLYIERMKATLRDEQRCRIEEHALLQKLVKLLQRVTGRMDVWHLTERDLR